MSEELNSVNIQSISRPTNSIGNFLFLDGLSIGPVVFGLPVESLALKPFLNDGCVFLPAFYVLCGHMAFG